MILKILPVILVLCSVGVLADIAHLAATKATILQKILHKRHKHHHKRGVFAGVPPYKLGYDIPVVSHSVIKPLLVTYPTRPVPIGVKIPLKNPYEVKYPLPIGHGVPVPHHGYGLKFPGWHKPLIVQGVPLTEQHDHHDHHIHHHHVAVRPAVVPVASPAIPVPAAVPFPAPVPIPAPAIPVAQPVHFQPPVHFHPSPAVPVSPFVQLAPRPVSIRPAFPVLQSSPLVPVAAPAQPLYHIRPGNSVQASYFATYPRYPSQPLVPVPIQPAPLPVGLPSVSIGVPAGVPFGPHGPHYHVVPQPHVHEVHPEHHPTQVVPLQPTGSSSGVFPGVVQPPHPGVFVQQPPVATDGWNPITSTAPTFSTQATQITPAHGYPVHTPTHHFTEGHAQVYENSDHNFHQQLDHEHQLNLQHYDQHQHQLEHHQIQQQQFEQQQAEQHQLQQQYEQHQAEQHQAEQHQAEQHQAEQLQAEQHQSHYDQHQANQYHHQQHQINQEYGAPQQEYGVPQQQINLDYGAPQQLGQDYGLPQHQERLDGNEGRSYQEENSQQEDSGQRWHNHIPLGLQLPLDRPLEDFH